MNYNQSNYTLGFRLFDKNNNSLLEIGSKSNESKEILLEEDDRIVGFESRLHKANEAHHNSLVLVIARQYA